MKYFKVSLHMVVYFRICFIYKSCVSIVYLDLAILVAYFITLLGKVLFSKYMEEAQDIKYLIKMRV